MSFVAPQFLLFLAVSLLGYFLAPQRWRWPVLLAASYVFYWFSGGVFAVAVISFTSLSTYLSGLWAHRLRTREAVRALRRLPLAVCVAANFGLLAFFKFSDRLAPSLGLLLIPGISFYTFQAVGYLVDIYRGKLAPERNPLKFALFLAFFPQLIQGPISRHSEIAEALYAGSGWDWERARLGATKLIWGYFLKILIADIAAVPVEAVFSGYASHGGAVIAFGAVLYRLQIYADFAGGIYIAQGIADFVGVSLPDNFRQPFFARTLTDYWRRWHITLGAWLKDYLFYPIALSKPLGKLGRLARRVFGPRLGKILPASVATFAVYLVMGVWHGSKWKSVAFGLFNGGIITLSLCIEPAIAALRARTGIDGQKPGFWRVFAAVRTFIIVMALSYLARAASFMTAVAMYARTAAHFRPWELWDGSLAALGLGAADYALLIFCTALLFARDALAERSERPWERLCAAKPAAQFALLFVLLGLITLFGIYRTGYVAAEFIYAQY
ncbi:MAG: hypothetical protein LBJ99_03605 [Oscillospiraceae bacterium]|nr:hypothetical protein [Oscillospiraceae bacterium]